MSMSSASVYKVHESFFHGAYTYCYICRLTTMHLSLSPYLQKLFLRVMQNRSDFYGAFLSSYLQQFMLLLPSSSKSWQRHCQAL